MTGEAYRFTARIGHRVGLHKWRLLPDQRSQRCTWCGAVFQPQRNAKPPSALPELPSDTSWLRYQRVGMSPRDTVAVLLVVAMLTVVAVAVAWAVVA